MIGAALLGVDGNGQPSAALAAAIGEDLGAALGGHAREKPVGAKATGVVGLECALGLCHDCLEDDVRAAPRSASHWEADGVPI